MRTTPFLAVTTPVAERVEIAGNSDPCERDCAERDERQRECDCLAHVFPSVDVLWATPGVAAEVSELFR